MKKKIIFSQDNKVESKTSSPRFRRGESCLMFDSRMGRLKVIDKSPVHCVESDLSKFDAMSSSSSEDSNDTQSKSENNVPFSKSKRSHCAFIVSENDFQVHEAVYDAQRKTSLKVNEKFLKKEIRGANRLKEDEGEDEKHMVNLQEESDDIAAPDNIDEYVSYRSLFENDKNFVIEEDGWVKLASEEKVERSSILQRIIGKYIHVEKHFKKEI